MIKDVCLDNLKRLLFFLQYSIVNVYHKLDVCDLLSCYNKCRLYVFVVFI
jgi:hypothetical protein